MLVLTRLKGQTVILNDDIEVTILSIRGNQVKIGIKAPIEIPVRREELLQRIQQEFVTNEEKVA
jgi:carbon storage regulator